MQYNLKIVLLYFFFCNLGSGFYAQNPADKISQEYFTVRGSVKEKYTNQPVSKVKILVNGSKYQETDYDGAFKIKVKRGDEVIISHINFETIYHTITSKDRLSILVEPQDEKELSKSGSRY